MFSIEALNVLLVALAIGFLVRDVRRLAARGHRRTFIGVGEG